MARIIFKERVCVIILLPSLLCLPGFQIPVPETVYTIEKIFRALRAHPKPLPAVLGGGGVCRSVCPNNAYAPHVHEGQKDYMKKNSRSINEFDRTNQAMLNFTW
jgi:hypothetical protein